MAKTNFGVVLVTGGAGFLGYHIVAALLEEVQRRNIHVLSRNPTENTHDGVNYHACDLRDVAGLTTLVKKLKPRTIFHTASTLATRVTNDSDEYAQTNIVGAENLLLAANDAGTVEVLVYTSSQSVYSDHILKGATEYAPLCTSPSQRGPYAWSKAEAERKILAANRVGVGELKTASLRVTGIYGERDNQVAPATSSLVDEGKAHLQTGGNSNLTSLISVADAAKAHILTAKALHDPSLTNGDVAGEAFNLCDSTTMPLWTYLRKFMNAELEALGRPRLEDRDITVIPTWLAMLLARLLEISYWVCTLGQQKPLVFNTEVVRYCTQDNYIDGSKARKVLGLRTTNSLVSEVEGIVRWELARQGRLTEKIQ